MLPIVAMKMLVVLPCSVVTNDAAIDVDVYDVAAVRVGDSFASFVADCDNGCWCLYSHFIM